MADPNYGVEIPDFPTDPGYDIPETLRERLAAIYKALAVALAKIVEEIRNRPRPDNSLPGEDANGIGARLEALKERLEELVDQIPHPAHPIAPTPEPKKK